MALLSVYESDSGFHGHWFGTFTFAVSILAGLVGVSKFFIQSKYKIENDSIGSVLGVLVLIGGFVLRAFFTIKIVLHFFNVTNNSAFFKYN